MPDEIPRPTPPLPPDVDSLIHPAERRSAYAGLFRNRNYRLWFFAAFAASLGDWAGLVALQTVVTQRTMPGSRLALFALGGIMMARLLPSIVVGPLAGVLADRYDRKRLMVFTNMARGVLFVGIALSRDLVALFAITFVVECLSLLFLSAKDAALPNMVERHHLTEANQLNLLVTYGTLPVGALFATLMIPAAGLLERATGLPVTPPTLVLLMNAVTFVVAASIMAALRLPPHGRRAAADDTSSGVMEELREGLAFIRGLPLIRSLILGVVGVFFGAGVVVTLGPEFVRTSLGARESDWFTLMAVVGVGLVTGIVLVGPLTRRVRSERLFPVSLALTGGLAAVIATLPSFRVTLGFGFMLGVTAGISFVLGYTLLHQHTADEVRARTFAAFYTGTRVSMFTALALAPFLAGAVGRGTLIVGNTVITMSGVRIMILLGGLVGLVSALLAGRGMYKALADGSGKTVRLPASRPTRGDRGVFVAFEGVEGAGKSTQVEVLAETLRAEGCDVVVTREPGGSPIAERIRDLLLDPDPEAMHARTEALLYAAARAEHVQRVILPALQAGKVVVCDRFLDSSLAYQGFARGLGLSDVAEINQWGIEGVLPDVTVLLYLDPDEGLRRVRDRTRRRRGRGPRLVHPPAPAGDRIEQEGVDFHRRVAEGYLTLAREDRARFEVVDASGDPETVARQVRLALHKWLPLPRAARETPAARREAP